MAYIALEIPQHHSQSIMGDTDAVLHITMCHLGKITWEQSQRVVRGLEEGAKSLPPYLQMKATDFLVFGSPEEPCLVRKVVCDNYPDLEGMRNRLANNLDTIGIAVSRKFEPWVPHVTVGPGEQSRTHLAAPNTEFQVWRIGLFASPLILHWSIPLGA